VRMVGRHEQFLRRAARMLAASERGEAPPADAEYHMDELKSLDANASDLAVELLGSTPRGQDWTPPVSFAYRGYGSENSGDPMWWLKRFRQGLLLSKSYFESFLPLSQREVHVGDKINVGAAHVVMGSHASARDISTEGSVRQQTANFADLKAVADELAVLRKALRKENSDDDVERDAEIGAIALAEQAARGGDHNKMVAHLRPAGKWALEIASRIGVSLASSAIKSAMGLGS
jgi:hypothetical protein